MCVFVFLHILYICRYYIYTQQTNQYTYIEAIVVLDYSGLENGSYKYVYIYIYNHRPAYNIVSIIIFFIIFIN